MGTLDYIASGGTKPAQTPISYSAPSKTLGTWYNPATGNVEQQLYAGSNVYVPISNTTGGAPSTSPTANTPQDNTTPQVESSNIGMEAYTASQTAAREAAAAAARQAAIDQQETDATRAMYDTKIGALRGQLGLIDPTRQKGLGELNTTYTNQLNEGETQYGTKLQDNIYSREKAYGGIGDTARNNLGRLRQVLGMTGSPNQSAAMVARYAVDRDATGQRTNATELYGRNELDINTAKTKFKKDLETDKKTRERTFLEGLLEQENSLNADIGQSEMQKQNLNGGNYNQIRAAYTPYQATIDANNAKLQGMQTQYATPLATKAEIPTLADYSVDKTKTDAQNQGGDENSPYSSYLLRKKLTGQA